MNENERKLIEISTEKRLSLGNTFFEKRDIHKFTWVSGMDGVMKEVKIGMGRT